MSERDRANPFGDPLGPNPLGGCGGVGGPDPADVDPPIPDDLVDAFFDRELDEEARRRFTRNLDADPFRCERVAKTHRMLSMLRRGVRVPDQTDAILDRVDRVRGFVSPRGRVWIRAGRVAAAIAMLGLVAGAVMVRRSVPEIAEIGMTTPVDDVACAAREDASGLTRFAHSVRTLPDAIAAPVRVRAAVVAGHAENEITWSPTAVIPESPEQGRSVAVLVVGSRVIVLDGLARQAEARAPVAPVSFTPRPLSGGLRSTSFTDLP